MTRSPILWGMGLAFALGGAIAGSAVGSTPVSDRSTVAMYYQSHRTSFADRQDQRALPNHYPLVTKDGVVEVAHLSDRGLFSQARYRLANPAAAYADAQDSDPGSGLADGYTPALHPAPTEVVPPAEPISLAQAPADMSGQAKIIDVQATLAMR